MATVPSSNIKKSEYSDITRNDFPDDFVFGTATSAYQHEGGATKGGRGLSVWDAFTLENPGRIADGSNGNEAADMYTRYKEDIKMMKNMGFDAYRFSISWPRILPGGKLCLGVNREGINYYNDLINTLLANGIEPYVTLFHWDLPYTLAQEYGGFLSKNIVDDFRDFAEVCFWEFGDRVKHWITLNEPWSYCVHGYVGCVFPPGKVGPVAGVAPDSDSDSDSETESDSTADPLIQLMEAILSAFCSDKLPKKSGYSFVPYKGYRKVETAFDLVKYGCVSEEVVKENLSKDEVTKEKAQDKDHLFASAYITNLAKDAYVVGRNMLLAHAEAVHSYRTKFKGHQKGEIGITLVTHWFEPLYDEREDKEAARRALDFMLGWFLQPVLIGTYPKNMTDNVPREYLEPFTPKEKEKLTDSIDFLGLNYYTSFYASAEDPGVINGYNKDQQLRLYKKRDGERIGEKSGAKWLHMVPSGFYKLLERIEQKYSRSFYLKHLKDKKFPEIYITENGYADRLAHNITARDACRDPKRIRYYQDHLGHLLKAINSLNLNIKGYFAWSWCDNFEWADGYTYRFGLVHIDYKNNLRRCPKDSAMWFAKFLMKEEEEKEEESLNQNQNQNQLKRIQSKNEDHCLNQNQNQLKRIQSKNEDHCLNQNEKPRKACEPRKTDCTATCI